MKKSITFLLLSLALFDCQETREESQHTESSFTRSVGKQIPIDVANRWIVKWQKSGSNARQFISEPITSATLRQLLPKDVDVVGINLVHAINEGGQHTIVLSPLDAHNLELIPDGISTSSGQIVSIEQQLVAFDRYKAVYPNGPWSHYFGIEVFNRVLQNQRFQFMQIEQAVNDEGEPQLLIFAWYGDTTSGGREKEMQLEVYDKSNPCPPICGGEN